MRGGEEEEVKQALKVGNEQRGAHYAGNPQIRETYGSHKQSGGNKETCLEFWGTQFAILASDISFHNLQYQRIPTVSLGDPLSTIAVVVAFVGKNNDNNIKQTRKGCIIEKGE